MLYQDISIYLPQVCAPRNELLGLISQRAEKPYVYVQAPAGYGKTVSVLLWLKKMNCPFVWMVLDEYDNKAAIFYRSLCQKLLELEPQNETVTSLAANPSFLTAPVESAIEFLTGFTWLKERYCIVFDDFHAMSGSETVKSLPFVLKRLPPRVTVFFLSRTAMPDEISAVSNAAAFVGSAELAFNPGEIQKHYADYGRIISAKEAFEIHSHTGGWIIILNAMAQSGNIAPAGGKASWEEFFEKNIWNGIDKTVRIFLLKTAAVDSLTAELCLRLTKNDGSAELLEKLVRENIPISRLGNEYRYHNLFLEFLRKALPDSGIDQAELYNCAALYYLENSQYFRAASYAMRTDNAELKTQVIRTFFQSKNPPLEQFLELSTLYEKISLAACDRSPILYMPKILSAFLKGKTESVCQLFDMFYRVINVLLDSGNPLVNTIATRLLLDFRIKLAAMPSFIESLRVPADMKVQGQAAVITMQMPFAHRSIRDFYEFLETPARETMNGIFTAMYPADYVLFYKNIIAGLLMEQNNHAQALAIALSAYEAVSETTVHELVFCVSINLAELYLLKGESAKRLDVMNRLNDYINKNKAWHLSKNLSAYILRSVLWNGDKKAAEKWLKEYYVSGSSFGELYRIYQNFTTVRAYIALAEFDKALSALEQLAKLGTETDRPLDTAEAEVLLSVTEWVTGRKKEARDRLYKLLVRLLHFGFIRIIANEGKAVLPILGAVIKKLNSKSDSESELCRFAREVYVAAYEQAGRYSGLTSALSVKPVKLSARQTEILELLSKGHSNSEIVKITGLSINTVKSYTKIIYQKLNVTNAMDAILKAKNPGLPASNNFI